MSDLPDELNRLASRLETLEQRVHALEHPSEATDFVSQPAPGSSQAAQSVETSPSAPASGMFSVVGKALLGIAGAYLLRAVAESTSLPKLSVAVLAIAYAIMWLVWASRVKAGEWLAGTVYACTSALILAPMLWELTLRFKVMPATITAGVLCGFAITADLLAWKRNLASTFWVANVTAAFTALALSIASHQVAPFIVTLLMVALICELAEARNRKLGVRPLVALAADLGVWALIFIYSGPRSARVDYPSAGTASLLTPGLILFLIFAASVAFKAVVRQTRITAFETIQTMIAFLLAASSLLYFGPTSGKMILGIVCIALSAASYAAVFIFFDNIPDRRNYTVFASWSAALFLAGSLLCLPPLWMAVGLGAAAVVATASGARLSHPILELHGMLYLISASAVSGLLIYVFRAFAGNLPGAPELSVCVASVCAALCYATAKHNLGEPWRRQFVHIVSASLATGAAAALMVKGLASLIAFHVSPGAHHIASIRTLILCVAALALAFSGSHWHRTELTRLGYAALVLVAAKLVFEDLRLGHLEFIAASIFLFAITLIAVPRIARMGLKA